VACLIAGLRIPLLVSRVNGSVEQPDRVKNRPPSNHLRLLPTRAGQVMRIPLRLCSFASVLVGMLVERYLPSVDLRVELMLWAGIGIGGLTYLWFQIL